MTPIQLWNFKVFAKEKFPAVITRFEHEADRVLRVLNSELAQRPYLVGDRYGIADVMTWPWINVAESKLKVSLAPYPNLSRWFRTIGERPSVQRGLKVPDLGDEAHAA